VQTAAGLAKTGDMCAPAKTHSDRSQSALSFHTAWTDKTSDVLPAKRTLTGHKGCTRCKTMDKPTIWSSSALWTRKLLSGMLLSGVPHSIPSSVFAAVTKQYVLLLGEATCVNTTSCSLSEVSFVSRSGVCTASYSALSAVHWRDCFLRQKY
jgi:hypothetical protein